jgi:hypothetical protein
MSFSPLLQTLIFELWWLWLLVLASSIFKTPWMKGYLGEMIIRLSAHFFLNAKDYKAIHNVTLRTPDGTTQIDHIFVSQFGIFVVETKNYSGWIFGDEKQATWTQKIFKTSHKFQNPLRQNYKHIKALEALTQISPDKFLSVIVFVGGSQFKTIMPPNVTYASGFVAYIKSKTEIVLSGAEVELVYSAISNYRLKPSTATNREHLKNVQKSQDVNAARLCPKCGSEMVERTVKKGAKEGSRFWGCSNFPKCRVIQNIS